MAEKLNFIGPGDKVPFISQVDDISDPKWHDKFCGIVSAYMVLRYWWGQQSIPNTPNVEDVSDYGLEIDGYKEGVGWIHTKLADVARHYNHQAVARSWLLRDNDVDRMLEQGRLDTNSEIEHYTAQIIEEFTNTLYSELSKGVPVILSVKPGFGTNGDTHLIVVTAIAEDLSAVKINDPQTHKSEAGKELAMDRLLEYSNFNAIFVYR